MTATADAPALPFEPQSGDIVFVTQGNPFSYLIRLRQQDFDYSHVFIVGRQVDGRWTAFSTGVQKKLGFGYWFGETDLGEYLKGKTYMVQRVKGELKPKSKQQIVAKALKMLGAPYNTGGLLKLSSLGLFVAKAIRSLYRPPLEWPFVEMKSFFCSESVAYIYWAGAGIRLNGRAAKLDPSPYDLASVFYADQTEVIYPAGIPS
jgi:hypothetical protein